MQDVSREKFLKVYANLPMNIRADIVCVMDDKGPISWNVAYLEIVNDTLLGKDILKKLASLEFI